MLTTFHSDLNLTILMEWTKWYITWIVINFRAAEVALNKEKLMRHTYLYHRSKFYIVYWSVAELPLSTATKKSADSAPSPMQLYFSGQSKSSN
jgi:hypothetical protein